MGGAERILDVLGFDAACRGCEAVVTGEGCLDASSLEGKLPVVVARRAHTLMTQWRVGAPSTFSLPRGQYCVYWKTS
jgi:glycerate kinase